MGKQKSASFGLWLIALLASPLVGMVIPVDVMVKWIVGGAIGGIIFLIIAFQLVLIRDDIEYALGWLHPGTRLRRQQDRRRKREKEQQERADQKYRDDYAAQLKRSDRFDSIEIDETGLTVATPKEALNFNDPQIVDDIFYQRPPWWCRLWPLSWIAGWLGYKQDKLGGGQSE